ncbi:MAG TPA: hypothetical protein VKB80_09655 [Kofleriaceae bacterium]|nr:hypothetical protein [Kofleriaceae bacterium]
MKIFRTCLAVAVFLTATIAGARGTLADINNYWSSPGAGCVPVDDAIQGDLYLVAAGSVKHDSDSTGIVIVSCPISRNADVTNPTDLYLSFADSSTTANNYVKATLWKKNRSTATVTSLASITSDSFDPVGDTQASVFFSHTFDFNLNYYYIYGEFNRTTTSTTETLQGVALGFEFE